ncbi:MAG: FAD-binding protein [Verrucomicrobia bacterium]|jgi:succinate dehydrogenase/fumarate reductase flavoprotein subunit|nr:FAD-binding protein [Verrucomicrobiota bacterium]
MKKTKLRIGKHHNVDVTRVHSLVIGSGAAGLNAAVQLRNQGIEDVLIVSEGLKMGTSINTGSDKQTYYKSAMCGNDLDAPLAMAKNFFMPGSMHGDLALIEAAVSARGFLNLVNLGVKFPQDAFGQFIGYKTDHDPAQRGTSVGPYTSRDMCRALIAEVKNRKIPVQERVNVVSLLTTGEGKAKRACGALALNAKGELVAFAADNVVFAVGGPGGLYKTSVYPVVQTGAIGIALRAGATAQGLPEAQYGLASTKFRWNVSGTYMQVVPKFVSTDADGKSNPREFMRDYFSDSGKMNSKVFLKGYQWPFDSKKIIGGSSIVDILVYIETALHGRRVFLDYRENPKDFDFKALDEEAYSYLKNSKAFQKTPIARLTHMNPGAIGLYKDHGIDITTEPLEVAVCAQHNNGGLAGNHWWESTNIKHLFPVGEVNGSHGVARPGGSALNSGQVGSIRAAEYIANCYADGDLRMSDFNRAVKAEFRQVSGFLARCEASNESWRAARAELQERMSKAGAHIRSLEGLKQAVKEARAQVETFEASGCKTSNSVERVQAMRNRQLCFAHWIYLAATLHHVNSGVGSRGSAMVQDASGQHAHKRLDKATWSFLPENESFRSKVQETVFSDGKVRNRWVKCRPIPESNLWFETAWADYRAGVIYK